MEATGEKKPARGGLVGGGAGPKVPAVSPEMVWAGVSCFAGLDLYDPETLAEEVYIAMEEARQRALVARMSIGEMAITREMIGAGLRWLDSDDPAGAVKDVFEEMMKVVCTTPELRLAYLALLSESAPQGSATHPA